MKTIAIVAGGNSSEFEISVKSAEGVSKALAAGFSTYVIMIRGINWYWEDSKGRYHNIDKNDFTLGTEDRKIRFDAVFIAIHGAPGENGQIQGYFDMLGMPYTSCNAFCSALTFNKQACKLFLREYGIPMADSLLIRKNVQYDPAEVISRIGLPCFIKPNDSGSSFGVSKVKTSGELVPAIEKAFGESNEVIAEVFMKGREVACGVVKTKKGETVLPVTEIISKNEFFDYEAKYTPGRSDEVTPANLESEITAEIQKLSSVIYDLLGCKGIVRVDFIIIDGKPNFLEINTVPGMTEESLIPKQLSAAGISQEIIYTAILEDLLT